MQKKLIYTVNAGLLALLVCAGCKSKEVPPPEFVNIPVYVAAQTIPADSSEKVRSNPVMRSYAVGRYVDPNRRNVMHEQHTVYREEQSPRWNLIPQPDADPVLMAQRQKQERYADAISGQIALAAQDMRETHAIVKKVLESQTSLEAKAKELTDLIEGLQKRYGIVSGNLLKSSEYINKLEGDLQKLQQETEFLKLQLRRKSN